MIFFLLLAVALFLVHRLNSYAYNNEKIIVTNMITNLFARILERGMNIVQE